MRIKAVAATVLIAFSPFIAHGLEDNEEGKTPSQRTFKAANASQGADYQPQPYGNKPVSFEPSDFSPQGFESSVRYEPPKPQPKSQQLSSLQHNPPSSADYR